MYWKEFIKFSVIAHGFDYGNTIGINKMAEMDSSSLRCKSGENIGTFAKIGSISEVVATIESEKTKHTVQYLLNF